MPLKLKMTPKISFASSSALRALEALGSVTPFRAVDLLVFKEVVEDVEALMVLGSHFFL